MSNVTESFYDLLAICQRLLLPIVPLLGALESEFSAASGVHKTGRRAHQPATQAPRTF